MIVSISLFYAVHENIFIEAGFLNEAAAQMHIEHEVNGLLADCGNEQQFLQNCDQAMRLVSDDSLRTAAHRSVSNLTWDTVAQRLVDIAGELIEVKNGLGD